MVRDMFLCFLFWFFAVDSELIEELNRLRSDPAKYASFLEGRLKYYRGQIVRLPKQAPVQTKEGSKAVQEAIRVLRAQAPLSEVKNDDALARMAREHVRKAGPKGLVEHSRVPEGVGEVISFGPERPRDVIIELLVDDGVRSRGHRKLLLDPAFRFAGAACGPHAIYQTMCVIDLSLEKDPTPATPKRQ